MKSQKAPRYIYLACMIFPIVIAVILFFFLPDTIPAHLTNGVIDRYGNKAEVFIIPIVNFLILFAFKAFFRFLSKNSLVWKPNVMQPSFSAALLVVGVTFFGLCIWYYVWLLYASRLSI